MRGVQLSSKEIVKRRESIKSERVRQTAGERARFDAAVDGVSEDLGVSRYRAELIVRGLVKPR